MLNPTFKSRVFPGAQGLFRDLLHFPPKQEDAFAIEATANFVSSPQSFYVYAGNRFDQLFTQLNKKYGLRLRLPLTTGSS
jgi:hypothetical protein